MKKWLFIIIAAFTISFLVMVGVAYYSVNRLDTLIRSTEHVEASYNTLAALDKLEVLIKDIDRQERGYMLTKDSQYVRLLQESQVKLMPVTEELKKMTIDNPVQHDNVIWIRSWVVSRLDDLKSNLAFADTASANAISEYFNRGKISMQRCLDYLQKMRINEFEILSKRTEIQRQSQRETSSNQWNLFFGFSVLTILLFIIMISELRKRFRYQDELHERLIDLRRSHNELEQIAFAASHDLQEPLRKMQVFINRLMWQKKDVDEDSMKSLERINSAAERMQDLIEDLADLTNLVTNHGEPEKTDLNEIFKLVQTELQPKIEEKNATVQTGKLPEINGYPSQLQLIFKALLDNSLKFSKESASPVIVVKADKVNGQELAEINKNLSDQLFHRISFSDNGIGFDNKFMHKMFLLFQRLHNQQSIYEGKGIGLAISQRVMANHKGYILAHGHPNAGSTFKLYFPVDSGLKK